MKIGTNSYRGEAPRITPRELPVNGAQVAANCRLQTGDLESWRQFRLEHVLANTGPVQTIYKLSTVWLAWNEQVDVARGLIPGDTTFRTFLTSPGLYTTPRYTTFALATGGAEPYPVTTLPLGVPEPGTAPSLVAGVDTTSGDFHIDITDAGDAVATAWVTSPSTSGSNFASDVSQSAAIGNPLPSLRLNFYNNNLDKPCWAFRSFGTASATVVEMDVDFYMTSAGGQYQARMRIANDVDGKGLSAQVHFPSGTGGGPALAIDMPLDWHFPGSPLAQMALAPMTMSAWYRMRMVATKNTDGTVTLKATLYATDFTTVLGELTHTATATLGDYCGFNASAADLGGAQQTYFDNIHILASGPSGLTPQNTATSYVYTFVNNLGEESAPSPASKTVLRPNGVSITVTTPTTTPVGTDPDYNIVSKRLYRTVTGTLGTLFLEVATIPLATADFVDNLTDSQVGPNVLESEDWDLPPARLEGIISLPNGIMAGFFDNQLCLSERGRPHAWPVKYRMTTDTSIVAIGNVDNTVVVGTLSFVYTATGNLPDSYSMSQPGEAQSCVSKRSMTFLDGLGVVFASPDGYQVCSGSAGAVRNATELIFTRRQWQALDPSSVIASVHDAVLHFFFAGTEPDSGYMLDVKPQGFGLVRATYHATAMHSDPITDHLYVVLDSNSEPTDALLPLASTAVVPNGVTIFQFDGNNTSDMVYRWRGRLNLTPYPATLAIAQVRALAFDNLIWRLYGDGALIHEKVVHNQREFTLPLPGTFDTLEVEIMGTSTVRNDQAAEDVGELT